MSRKRIPRAGDGDPGQTHGSDLNLTHQAPTESANIHIFLGPADVIIEASSRSQRTRLGLLSAATFGLMGGSVGLLGWAIGQTDSTAVIVLALISVFLLASLAVFFVFRFALQSTLAKKQGLGSHESDVEVSLGPSMLWSIASAVSGLTAILSVVVNILSN